MLQKITAGSLVLSSLLVLELLGAAEDAPVCGASPRPMRVSARHIEANGVGYNQGYSTLEGFFSPIGASKWVPFLDVRGHIFNDGKPAANAGLGLRYVASRVWGINAYYDYRKTHCQHYNQVSVGLESLGRILDFRINGYLPVGDKTSSFFHTRFDRFEGNHMILSRKQEFAFKGANAEIGAHLNQSQKVPVYLAAGPYYLTGKGQTTWGGEARLAIDLFDYVRLEGNTSYDSAFQWIGQGQVSLNVPFGARRQVKKREGKSCRTEMALSRRAVQRVDRNEIIPVDNKHQHSIAINPATGEPFFFWFVDNTSSSNGTFESPFNNLLAAQNASSPFDIIYVLPGDRTDRGMNAGITLKDHQMLLGSGMSHDYTTTLGLVTAPGFAPGMAILTNSGSASVTCANGNEIAALRIVGLGQSLTLRGVGILCNGITDVYVHDNQIGMSDPLPNDDPVGVRFLGSFGNLIVVNNIFDYITPGNGWGIQIVTTGSGSSYTVSNNNFAGFVGCAGTGMELGDGDGPTIGGFNILSITNNLFNGLGQNSGVVVGGKAIGGRGFGSTGTVVLENNIFNQCDPNTGSTVLLRLQSGADINVSATNNTWQNSQVPSLRAFTVTSSVNSSACVTFKNNTSDSTPIAYLFDNSAGTIMTVDISDNVGTVQELNTTPGTCPNP